MRCSQNIVRVIKEVEEIGGIRSTHEEDVEGAKYLIQT